MRMSADISPCGTYRYLLTREWDAGLPKLTYVMLNPSAADASSDDPTIRRCIGFARREGCGGILIVNVFAYRTASPRALALAPAPVGPRNKGVLCRVARRSQRPIVCAWGAYAGSAGFDAAAVLRGVGAELVCFGKTKGGAPRHPLYVRGDTALEPYR
ncbi:MAG: DUF1643 domain-containing protein [Chloroflexota bacterium]|jgi:hypothetical protein